MLGRGQNSPTPRGQYSRVVDTIDTNILLRATLGDHPEMSPLAQKLIEESVDPLDVPDVVLIEYVHVLEHHYQFNRHQVADLLGDIAAHPNLSLRHDVVEAAVGHYLKHPKLSFVDCFIAEETRARGVEPLWTFDRKLVNQLIPWEETTMSWLDEVRANWDEW
ncbi:MAG: PIN domain-containing protein [Propionibacteriaceae bacterium]|nr:PIN domain-containing protein [Propionibacteriaceae bacterium]